MSKFQKGKSGNPSGRPVGSKNYTNISLWLEVIFNELAKMDPDKRLEHSWMAVDKLLTKVQSLPATPGDSVSNALLAAQTMSALSTVVPPVESNPGASGGPNGNGSHTA